MMTVLYLLLIGFFLKALVDIVFNLERIIFLLEEILELPEREDF